MLDPCKTYLKEAKLLLWYLVDLYHIGVVFGKTKPVAFAGEREREREVGDKTMVKSQSLHI